MPGFKYNLSDLQAAIGLHQLEAIEARLVRRQAICDRYDDAFGDLPLVRFAGVPDGDRHARHLYPVLIDPQLAGCTRDDVERRLGEEGVSASVHFRALHLHRYYREQFDFHEGQFPNAEYISDRVLSLPLSASLSDDQVSRVIEVFRRAIRGEGA
jgi:dTDP-4-amino-4,6-dideoxygalactose transaminase